MDEREYRRRIDAQRRVISQSEYEQRNKLKDRSNNKDTQNKEVKSKYQQNDQSISFVVTVIGLALTIVCSALFLLFYVQEVGVTGNEYSDSGEIIEWLSEDPTSINSIAMYIKYNFTDAELPSQIKEMSIDITDPWTLWVTCIEKTPVGGVKTGAGYVYCDIEGVVLLVTEEPVEDLPLIEGISIDHYVLYDVVPVDDIDIFKNALEVTSILNIEEITFDEISCSSGAGVDLTIGNILVKLGEGNYQEKIVQITPILEEIGEEEGTLNLETYSSTNQSVSFQRKNTEN